MVNSCKSLALIVDLSNIVFNGSEKIFLLDLDLTEVFERMLLDVVASLVFIRFISLYTSDKS